MVFSGMGARPRRIVALVDVEVTRVMANAPTLIGAFLIQRLPDHVHILFGFRPTRKDASLQDAGK
jgi:hypothetical protein